MRVFDFFSSSFVRCCVHRVPSQSSRHIDESRSKPEATRSSGPRKNCGADLQFLPDYSRVDCSASDPFRKRLPRLASPRESIAVGQFLSGRRSSENKLGRIKSGSKMTAFGSCSQCPTAEESSRGLDWTGQLGPRIALDWSFRDGLQ